MTSGEKALYHSIIEQLKDKELSDSQKSWMNCSKV